MILDVKYEKLYFNKFIKGQCQHLTEYEKIYLSSLLINLEYLFYGALGMCNTSPVDFEF